MRSALCAMALGCAALNAAAAPPLPRLDVPLTGLEAAPTLWRRGDAPERAAAAQAALDRITPPLGFSLHLYALAPGVTRLASGTRGAVIFAGHDGPGLTALIDEDRDERAEEAIEMAPGWDHGGALSPCPAPDGTLLAAGPRGVAMIPAAEFVLRDPDLAVHSLSDRAGAGDCVVDHGGAVHVLYPEAGEIWRLSADGADAAAEAFDLTAPRALALRPETGALWVSEDGALNAAPHPLDAPGDAPGAQPLGMAFYHGAQFPPEYKGALFYAARDAEGEARLMVLRDPDAPAPEVVLEGWRDENGAPLGGPVDVALLRDGSLLLADPALGAVYRLSWGVVIEDEAPSPESMPEPALEPGGLSLDPIAPLQ